MEPFKSWNYRIEPRVSWVTGLPTEPAKPCRCGAEATCWVASDYVTGNRGRIATNYRGCCRPCADKLIARNTPTTPETETTMPRTKKTAEKPTDAATAPTPVRGRRGQRNAKETAPEAAPSAEYTPKELELRQKYPHDILPQSYRVAGAGDRPGWGKKHTVLVKCATEGCTSEPRCVATSDLQFVGTTRFCLPCAKQIKANRRRTREAKKALK